MRDHSVAGALARSAERCQRAIDREAWVVRVLSEIPENMPAPVISNESERAFFGAEGEPIAGAWLSWSRFSHGSDAEAVWRICADLEAAGWWPCPMSLAAWGQWRPSPAPLPYDDLPKQRPGCSNESLTVSDPLCAGWLVLSDREAEFRTYYRTPGGLLMQVTIELPLPARVRAVRRETLERWHYERGSATLEYPANWDCLGLGGEQVAQAHSRSCAYVETEQSISGVVYWEPMVDPCPLTPAGMVEALRNGVPA